MAELSSGNRPVGTPRLLARADRERSHEACPRCGSGLTSMSRESGCLACEAAGISGLPLWWNPRSLERMRRASVRVKWIVAVGVLMYIASLALSAMFASQAVDFGGTGFTIVSSWCTFALLVCAQFILHAIALETVARQPIGERRRRHLRTANKLRFAVVAALAVLIAILFLPGPPRLGWIEDALPFVLPATVLAADFLAASAFGALAREMEWRDTPWNEGATAVARGAFVLSGVLIALAVFFSVSGTWVLLAIALWLVALFHCFRGLERFASSGLAQPWPIVLDQLPPRRDARQTL